MGYDDKRAPREGGRSFGGSKGGRPYDRSRNEGGRGGERGDRPYGDRNRDDRGDRGGRSFGDKPRSGKPYGDKPRGGRDRGDRDRDGRSFGDRDRNDRPRGGKPSGGDRPRNGRPRGARHFEEGYGYQKPKKPKVGTSKDLKHDIYAINGRGFPAYKDLAGRYSFDGFELSIDHVQGDPFANPSHMSVHVPQDVAGFPAELFDTPWRLVALEDAILRRFSRALAQNACHFTEDVKGGAMTTSRPGAEVLKRSACTCSEAGVSVRLEVALPAINRSVVANETSEMLIDVLPRCVREALLYVSYDEGELQAVANLADDQHTLREELERRNLVAFVADGAVLPRESGISSRPMQNALPFTSPESLRQTVDLPHAGATSGMAVPRGVTVIVGGGYHGKSTLLKAIQAGVYNHVAGDGRELVVCDATAVKLRSEDGRSVRDVNISLFIDNLPNDVDTESFWTEDASGSTSQAAATMEAIEAGARTFLIDEDTSATNFMVRDELMQAVIAREAEPITPFAERVRDLYERAGISTVLVAGSSGAFFSVADTVIQMEAYKPHDIMEHVRKVSAERGERPVERAAGFSAVVGERRLVTPPHPLMHKTASVAKEETAARREGRMPRGPERLKVKVFSTRDIVAGPLQSDMRLVEQLVDAEQSKTLAHIVRWCIEQDALARMSVREAVHAAWALIEEGGLHAISDTRYEECGMALPRKQEVFACLNRLRLRIS